MMRTICAWCGRLIREGDGTDDRISHGICAVCEAIERHWLDDLDQDDPEESKP